MSENNTSHLDIARQILFTTVRIDTEDKVGEFWSGTGFVIDYVKDGKKYPLLVTNKHVVKDMVKGELTFLEKKDGEPVIPSKQRIGIPNFESRWTGHPNPDVDVTVMPIGGIFNEMKKSGKDVFFMTLPTELFLKEEQLKDLSAIEEIIFVGYPDALRDEVNLTPITRRGITASPLDQDFDGKPIFLIDASVFGGSSGSPVLILNQGSYTTAKALVVGSRVILLGIVAESHYFFEEGKMGKEKVQTRKIPIGKQYLDIGVVFKASTIMETMEHWVEENQDKL